MFKCLECGKKYKTVKSAERASHDGCSGCGGVDIDVDPNPTPVAKPKSAKKPPAVKVDPVGGPENGGSVTITDGTTTVVRETTETDGFWFDHPDHGRVWVRVFEAR